MKTQHNRIRYVLTGRRVRGVWSVYVRDQYGARSGEGTTLGEAMIAAGVML